MLVLTRRRGQEIVIADNIRIKVLEITETRVRLGIDAPLVTKVVRGELPPKQQEDSDGKAS